MKLHRYEDNSIYEIVTLTDRFKDITPGSKVALKRNLDQWWTVYELYELPIECSNISQDWNVASIEKKEKI